MKRAVIFAHYDRDNLLDDYVIYYLRELSTISEYLVFVTTAHISHEAVNELDDICSKVVVRENKGHDFMSYKVGLECVDVSEYDEVVLCNDSVYGPIYSIVDVFKTMEDKVCSFWGITQSLELSYHLQSYFLVFRKQALNSSTFSEFWGGVAVSKSKKQIIYDNEVGLTTILLKNGFKAAAFVEYKPSWRDVLNKDMTASPFFYGLKLMLKTLLKGCGQCNVTHFFWKSIVLMNKMPFIKVDLLRDNYLHLSNVRQYKDVVINAGDNYPVELIENHLARMLNEK